jgi:hypothetical protein
MSAFEQAFLKHYLTFGLGSMPKSDVDALVMHLLDTHGLDGSPPLAVYSHQAVSEMLKTPVSKVKKLRYDAALKFGGDIAEEAKARLLASLDRAVFELEQDRILLIIEDMLAKHWLQGQLKAQQQVFDFSLNSEMIKVSAEGLFTVLDVVFDSAEVAVFKEGYESAKEIQDRAERQAYFKGVLRRFVESAAKAAGAGVLATLVTLLGS